MTQKHFKAFAEAINNAYLNNDPAKIVAARMVAKVCIRFCANFDLFKFLSACGVNEDE